jgi:hypothetical protein
MASAAVTRSVHCLVGLAFIESGPRLRSSPDFAPMLKPSHDQSQQIVHLGITLTDVMPEVSRVVAVPLG